MRRGYLILWIIGAMNLVSSCFKEDQPIPPHQIGNVITDTIEMTQNYVNQVYFDLGTGKVVATNVRTNSDIGFECSHNGWVVLLNTANFMKVADLGVVPFGQAQDTTHLIWRFDKSDGNLDSLGIGSWYSIVDGDTLSNQHVYAIDRGMDPDGNQMGYAQIIFDSLSRGTYYFRFADLFGGTYYAGSVEKDSTYNYRWFSFNEGGVELSNEPYKVDYDILFTQYTTMLYTDLGEPYPYLVTGVLLNRGFVSAGLDSIHPFSSITLAEAQQTELSFGWDRIGYDWKYYSFETGAYTMREGLVYIIKDEQGVYYKLRFIGFYNTEGVKGYPVIEYQSL